MQIAQALHKLNKFKNVILNIGIVILALIIANVIYNNQTVTVDVLKRNKENELKKNKLLDNIKRVDGTFISYKETINSKDMSQIINNISNMAKESDITIDSLKPQAEKPDSIYINYPFEMKMHAKSYHAIGRFISKLESNPYIFIVDNMTILQDKESQSGRLFVSLKFRTIMIQN